MPVKKTVRMIDVAREAGVSLTTVAQVLTRGGGKNVRVGEQTAHLVRKVADRLEYRPNTVAQQLAGKGSKIIAVLIDSNASPQSHKRLTEIEKLVHDQGYRLMIGHPMNDPELTANYVDDFLARGVDGLVCVHHAYPGRETLIPEVVKKLPHVVFVKKPALRNACYIDIDEVYGTELIVKHLAEQGCQRIALALADDIWGGCQQRLKGYGQGLKSNGLSFDESLIWLGEDHQLPTPRNHIDVDAAEKIIDALVEKENADAIIAMNDYWAARLLAILKRRHIAVPGEVAVVGYDNLDVSTYVEPELTTLDPLYHEAAEAAVDMLLQLVQKDKLPASKRRVIIKPELIVRNSG